MSADATCLDGRALTAFLESRRCEVSMLDAADRRAILRWRDGTQVRLETADRILIRLGYSVEELPADCWRCYDNGRRGYRKAA